DNEEEISHRYMKGPITVPDSSFKLVVLTRSKSPPLYFYALKDSVTNWHYSAAAGTYISTDFFPLISCFGSGNRIYIL
ncbi:hypothetical protein J6590_092624, partial [Homalodisca vitripennis]